MNNYTLHQIQTMYDVFIRNVRQMLDIYQKIYIPNDNMDRIECTDNVTINDISCDNFIKSYNSADGFMFPLLLKEDFEPVKSSVTLLDGHHRLKFIQTMQNKYNKHYYILGIVLKRQQKSIYSIIIPDFIADISLQRVQSCDIISTVPSLFTLNNISYSKITVNTLFAFTSLYLGYVNYLSLLIDDIGFMIKSNKLINYNVKSIKNPVIKKDDENYDLSFIQKNSLGIYRPVSRLEYENSDISKYVTYLYDDIYIRNLQQLENRTYLNYNTILPVNSECWCWFNNMVSIEEDLQASIITNNGIYLPIVYDYIDSDSILIRDGLHRYIVMCNLIKQNRLTGSYLLISSEPTVTRECTMHIPIELYNIYSYMLVDVTMMDTEIINGFESVIVCTKNPKSIRLLCLLIEKELNYLIVSGHMQKFNILPHTFINTEKERRQNE